MNYNIRDFGAVAGGTELCTDAIQKAIDACSESGGGRVTVTDGIYLTAFFRLKSGVELHIECGAVLKASTDGSLYPEFESEYWNTEFAPRHSTKCLIYAENCDNIAITGRGTIDCQGRYAVCPEDSDCGIHNGMWHNKRCVYDLPARMVFFIGCRDVLIEDVKLFEPCSGWGYLICDCDRVNMRGLSIDTFIDNPNCDGIHINCSRDVHISDCTIVSGDDSLAIRSYTPILKEKRPCERITVTNCNLVSGTSCIQIGWLGDYIMRDCVFSNCTIGGTNGGIHICFPAGTPPGEKSKHTDEGDSKSLVERISFDNIIITDCHFEPIAITVRENTPIEAIRDISFSNVRSVSGYMPALRGNGDTLLENIAFSNCTFRKGEAESPKPLKSSNYRVAPSDNSPIFEKVKNLVLDSTVFIIE